MSFDTDDLVAPIQASLESAAKSLYGEGQEIAAEDKEFFAEQATLLADLASDLAKADNDEDKAVLLGALEQQGTTVELKAAIRRFQLSQTASEEMKQVLKIAVETIAGFLRKIILG